MAPWNLLARDDAGMALIDWETAGPVDPLVELAQACWLNAQLHDDDVAAVNGLAAPAERAGHARLIADGAVRHVFVDPATLKKKPMPQDIRAALTG